MICADRIEKLREEVGARLSDKRYAHTLGVERAAARDPGIGRAVADQAQPSAHDDGAAVIDRV